MRAPWAWCWCCYSRRWWWSIATATTAAGAAGCEIQSTNPSGARHHPSIPAALLPPLLSSSVRPPRRLLPGVPRPARRRLSSVEVVVVVDAVGVSNESKVSRAWESTDQPADVSTPVRGRRRPGSTPRAMVDNAVRPHGPSAPPTPAPASKQPAMHAYATRLALAVRTAATRQPNLPPCAGAAAPVPPRPSCHRLPPSNAGIHPLHSASAPSAAPRDPKAPSPRRTPGRVRKGKQTARRGGTPRAACCGKPALSQQLAAAVIAEAMAKTAAVPPCVDGGGCAWPNLANDAWPPGAGEASMSASTQSKGGGFLGPPSTLTRSLRGLGFVRSSRGCFRERDAG